MYNSGRTLRTLRQSVKIVGSVFCTKQTASHHCCLSCYYGSWHSARVAFSVGRVAFDLLRELYYHNNCMPQSDTASSNYGANPYFVNTTHHCTSDAQPLDRFGLYRRFSRRFWRGSSDCICCDCSGGTQTTYDDRLQLGQRSMLRLLTHFRSYNRSAAQGVGGECVPRRGLIVFGVARLRGLVSCCIVQTTTTPPWRGTEHGLFFFVVVPHGELWCSCSATPSAITG